jgi:hypothetical protein
MITKPQTRSEEEGSERISDSAFRMNLLHLFQGCFDGSEPAI